MACAFGGDMRRLFWIGAICLGLGASWPTFAAAETNDPSVARALVGELEGRYGAIARLREMDDIASWVIEIEATALVAHYGAWPNKDDNWPAEWGSQHAYDTLKQYERLMPVAVRLQKAVERDKSLSPDDKALALETAANVIRLLEGSLALYELLKDGQIEMANVYFRDESRPLVRRINSDVYTLTTKLEREIKKAFLQGRILK